VVVTGLSVDTLSLHDHILCHHLTTTRPGYGYVNNVVRNLADFRVNVRTTAVVIRLSLCSKRTNHNTHKRTATDYNDYCYTNVSVIQSITDYNCYCYTNVTVTTDYTRYKSVKNAI